MATSTGWQKQSPWGCVKVPGCEAVLRRVPETLPPGVLEKMGAWEFQKEISRVPVCTMEELQGADAVIFGTPTRFVASGLLPECIFKHVSSHTGTLRSPPQLLVHQPTATELLLGPMFGDWRSELPLAPKVPSAIPKALKVPNPVSILPPKLVHDCDIEEFADKLRFVLTSLGREYLLNHVISAGRRFIKQFQLEEAPNRWLYVFVSAAIYVIYYQGHFGETDYIFSRKDLIDHLKIDQLTIRILSDF